MRKINSGTFVSRILTCAHILGILGMRSLMLVGMCRRYRVWTIHATCLSSSSLKLTYGCSGKRIIGGILMARLRIGRKFVLVMLLVVSGLRVGVGRWGMALWWRRVGIAMLVVLMMLSRLLVGHRVVDSGLVLMIVFMIRC
jgi:hypothetical protein